MKINILKRSIGITISIITYTLFTSLLIKEGGLKTYMMALGCIFTIVALIKLVIWLFESD